MDVSASVSTTIVASIERPDDSDSIAGVYVDVVITFADGDGAAVVVIIEDVDSATVGYSS